MPSEIIGRRIKELRTARGWSGRQLAEECRKIGGEISDNVIENIEGKRRRRDVTVEELFVLAVALDAPPLRLLIPDSDTEMAVTPDLSVDPMRLVMWMNGAEPAAGLPKVRFNKAAAPIALYREAHEAIEAAKNADRAVSMARGTDDEQAAREQRDNALRRMADVIRPVLLDGLLPGNLPVGWLREAVERGWLDSGAVPWDQVDAIIESWRRQAEAED